MNNVHWSPYTVVPYGEPYDSSISYYKLNDHSRFEEYTEGSAGWNNGTLNEKIYTYDDTANKSLITNLDIFDLFLADMDAVKDTTYLNQYRNISRDTVKSYPTITGEIYIDNSDSNEAVIIEDELTTKYNAVWPGLKITAARVSESFLGKYIVLEDSGKESEYDVIRYNPIQYEGQPITLTSLLNPSKGSTFDFVGWATDIAGENLVFDAEGNMTEYGQNYTFSAESRTVITLYAIFEDHQFTVTFKNAIDSTGEVGNPNDKTIAIKRATYGNVVTPPDILPVAALDNSTLALTDIYKFKGYTRLRTNTLVKSQSALRRALVDLSTMPLSEDVTLYACYMLQDVHDEPTNLDYFTFTKAQYYDTDSSTRTITNQYVNEVQYNVLDGVQIGIKNGVQLNGKITLPTYSPDGKPVIKLDPSSFRPILDTSAGGVNNKSWGITHIFWYETDGKPCELREISTYGFAGYIGITDVQASGSNLKFFDFAACPKLRVIRSSAFFFIRSLDLSLFELPDSLALMDTAAFNGAFSNSMPGDVVKIPGTVHTLGSMVMMHFPQYNLFQIGDSDNRSKLTMMAGTNILENDLIDQILTDNNDSSPADGLEVWANSEDQAARLEQILQNQMNFPIFARLPEEKRKIYGN